MRKGSDAEARKSLIEKYKDDINQTSEDNELYYNTGKGAAKTAGGGGGAENSMLELEEEIKQKRNRNIKIGLITGGILLLIVGIILIITLHSKHQPHEDPVVPPQPDVVIVIPNPYSI